MIRAILLSAIFATPAYAADRAAWGNSADPARNTSVQLAPADGPAVATVTVRNQLTAGHDTLTLATLDVPGLSVRVTVHHGPGDVPDRVTVTPPEGFIAVPPEVDVPEGGQAVIAIYEGLSS